MGKQYSVSKQSQATAASVSFDPKDAMLKGKRKKSKNTMATRRSQGLRLPKLNKAYLRYPVDVDQSFAYSNGGRMSSKIRKEVHKYTPKMCGICATIHAPAEPHRTKNVEVISSWPAD